MFGLDKVVGAVTNPASLLENLNPAKMFGDLVSSFSSPEGLMKLAGMAAPFAPPPFNIIAQTALGGLNGGGDPAQIAGSLIGGTGDFAKFKPDDIAGFMKKFL